MASEIRVNQIQNRSGLGTVTFGDSGVTVAGITTFLGNVNVSSGSSITVGDTFIKRGAVGLGTTDTTGRNAGVGTAAGTLIFNSTTGLLEVYNGNSWNNVSFQDPNIKATGGAITQAGGKVIHTFTGSGTFIINNPSLTSVNYLVVGGGGGGGGGWQAGGGGAGALRYATGLPVSTSPGSYTVTVGSGANGGSYGPAPSAVTQGGTGNSSSIANPLITTITSPGGGGGGSYWNQPGSPGGSGGGAGTTGTGIAGGPASGAPGGTNDSTSPTSGWGNAGGPGGSPYASPYAGGGGGGAGTAGSAGSASLGNGGSGLSYSITGITTTYAGGGGGGAYNGTQSTGGPGGGGAGGRGAPAADAVPGTVSTGSGGGGGGGSGPGGSPVTPIPSSMGGNGGSGIVIIAYPS